MTMYAHEGQEYDELRAQLAKSDARVVVLEGALADLQGWAAGILLSAPSDAVIFNGEPGFPVDGMALRHLGEAIDRAKAILEGTP